MAAPTWGASGTALTGGSSTTAAVPVPAGVAKDSIILVPLYVEAGQTVTPATGFAEAPSSPVLVTGASAHHLHVLWKRATGADSGTYSFTVASGLVWRFGVATRFDGCIPVGVPFESTTSAIKTTNTTGATPAVTSTTVGQDRLFVWVASSFVSNTSTAPGTTTERVDVSDQSALTLATKAAAVAGSSGSLAGTWSSNTAAAAWLGALKPAEQGMFFAAL